MKKSFTVSLLAALASVGDLTFVPAPTMMRPARPIYSKGGRIYTRGKRHYSQRVRANRLKAKRLKR